ncbi:unnamed protein product [Musa acuminata subsp. malaccensis]|uniref:(wild Malaysian banana) hypothetical protein n=1 Tax=Musa acuminata subsp. malaccensis TaxID=214687 RepID=A0A804K1Z9_MUSAM|nr:PREDICTED: uncharacterized protein LOC103994041 [Musa acuminata subsp. malaccensis]CAG1830341.1 unnamed protein product [Musa acuminata subsp. malaccensis]
MGVQVGGTCLQWPQLSPTNSTALSQAAFAALVSSLGCSQRTRGCDRALASPFLGSGTAKLLKSRSLKVRRGRGRRSVDQALRRAFSASLDRFATGDDEEEEEDEEFVLRLEELALELQRQQGDGSEEVTVSESWRSGGGEALSSSASFCSDSSPAPSPLPLTSKQEPSTEAPWVPVRPEPPEWPDQIVPASVEKNANSVELPLSLRIIKRKKRWEDGWLREAGESACCSVKRAFSSMVFMIREIQSYTLQMREVIFREDLQGILSRVQREMNSSFVWLFQQVFSCTPTLMVSVMLLLANFTVFSMGHLEAAAMAAPNPPTQSMVETIVAEDHRQTHHNFSIKKFSSTGRTASIGGGGGGKAKPVAGATGDGRSDDRSLSYRTILPDGVSTAPGATNTEEGKGASGEGESEAVAGAEVQQEEEARLWKAILEEASKTQARDEALMDPETLRRFVSPVTVVLEPDDLADYLRMEIMYHQALSQDPENTLLLANFAQFLYLVLHDHDRAEHYYKRAAGTEPKDAEALSRYASFLWLARKDLVAAEETYLEAIAADPGNAVHAANYAHFLWSTGGEDTCYPLEGDGAWR